MIDIAFFLVFAAVLFVIGMYGLLTSKKGLVTLMCIELMLNAANINFITFASFSGGTAGQVFVIMTIAVAAAEVAVGIALMLNAYKTKGTTEVDKLTSMRW
ncbi:MAG: NADH-quinone oxidoreductase subunit NuoK [Thermoplasmata archaeon]|nr:NADH-quinone oxidoreductase subunit NuoK [Thermoplasmata archaeon]